MCELWTRTSLARCFCRVPPHSCSGSPAHGTTYLHRRIYGVISFAVARQTREIGIRMALGARRGQVLGMVLKQGLALTVVGSTIGLGLALVLSRVAASLLYGVSPTDTVTFIGVPGIPDAHCAGGMSGTCAARGVARSDPLLEMRITTAC